MNNFRRSDMYISGNIRVCMGVCYAHGTLSDISFQGKGIALSLWWPRQGAGRKGIGVRLPAKTRYFSLF